MKLSTKENMDGNLLVSAVIPVAIAATFTAEPLEPFLRFWLNKIGLGDAVTFAPYNQVFQELLDPSSLLSNNKGVNILLLRLEDWTRYHKTNSGHNLLQNNLAELVASLNAFVNRSATPTLVWVSPLSPAAKQNPNIQNELMGLKTELRTQLPAIDSLHWLDEKDFEPYFIEQIDDVQADKLGHIPYTSEFFCALATVLARRIHRIRIAPGFKVLALDCDHTIWSGVVGEDGPHGISFPPGKKALQEMAVRLQEQGMLICLVSKNVEPDVLAVFEKRPEMPLQRKHVVGMRINWQSKPANLVELATELNLGLDSFIFLDDNPMECAEMRGVLPQVLTLQVPSNDAEIPEFLRHIWAFDRLKVTEEDRKRTLMYQQNSERNQFETQTSNILDFLEGLKLNIDISEPKENEWTRVSQLTQRTNQFNFTTIRRSETEVRQLSSQGKDCFRVQVTDRFGDYGLVGLVIYGWERDQLVVDTMLLSCRVLGRGVEHAMLAHLGKIALERQLSSVILPFIPTAKNQPAINFLESVASGSKMETVQGFRYELTASNAANTTYIPGSYAKAALELARNDGKKVPIQSSTKNTKVDKSTCYHSIVCDLRSVKAVQLAVNSMARRKRPVLESTFIAPQTQRERDLADIWTRLLNIDQVGIRDDFTALGGTSIIAARIFVEIEQRFGIRLPMTTILEAPTIEGLSKHMDEEVRSSLKILRPGKEGGPSLFLVHDGDGETLLYMNLASRLSGEVSVYGLEPLGNSRSPCLHSRIPEMAKYYIQHMRRVCPEGPYYVGGMCAGGVIAYEIAVQLRKSGEEVGSLFLLDAASPHAAPLVGLASRRRSERLKKALREEGVNLLPIWQRLLKRTAIITRKVRNSLIYETTSRSRRLWNKLRFNRFRKALDRGRPVSRFAQGLSVRTVYEFAEKDYFPPGKLDCPSILFQATSGEGTDEPFISRYSDPVFGWNSHLQNPIHLIQVPGGHSSMLQETNVADIAIEIDRVLLNARKNRS